MKNHKDAGFSAVEGLLILVIVGILGFTGWFVWHSKQNVDKTNQQAAANSQFVNTVATNKTYNNTEYNFMLTYPPSWGDFLAVKDVDGADGTKYAIGFSRAEKFGGAFSTSDWQSKQSDDAAAVFNGCKQDDEGGSYVIYTASDACIVFVGATIHDSTAEGNPVEKVGILTLQKELTNSKAEAIVFAGAPLAINDFSSDTLKKNFEQGYSYTSDTDLIQFVKSIKPIN